MQWGVQRSLTLGVYDLLLSLLSLAAASFSTVLTSFWALIKDVATAGIAQSGRKSEHAPEIRDDHESLKFRGALCNRTRVTEKADVRCRARHGLYEL